jgi:hypothetical protein
MIPLIDVVSAFELQQSMDKDFMLMFCRLQQFGDYLLSGASGFAQ